MNVTNYRPILREILDEFEETRRFELLEICYIAAERAGKDTEDGDVISSIRSQAFSRSVLHAEDDFGRIYLHDTGNPAIWFLRDEAMGYEIATYLEWYQDRIDAESLCLKKMQDFYVMKFPTVRRRRAA